MRAGDGIPDESTARAKVSAQKTIPIAYQGNNNKKRHSEILASVEKTTKRMAVP